MLKFKLNLQKYFNAEGSTTLFAADINKAQTVVKERGQKIEKYRDMFLKSFITTFENSSGKDMNDGQKVDALKNMFKTGVNGCDTLRNVTREESEKNNFEDMIVLSSLVAMQLQKPEVLEYLSQVPFRLNDDERFDDLFAKPIERWFNDYTNKVIIENDPSVSTMKEEILTGIKLQLIEFLLTVK